MTDFPEAAHHKNPYLFQPMQYGKRIPVGTTLEPTDLYASTTGKWELCPCPGIIMNSPDVIWVRPVEH